MIFIFVRDQFERYKFLGATRQSYFKIFYSDMNSERGEHSTLVVRHYSMETLDLLNEQILPISRKWDCLQGFCSTIKQWCYLFTNKNENSPCSPAFRWKWKWKSRIWRFAVSPMTRNLISWKKRSAQIRSAWKQRIGWVNSIGFFPSHLHINRILALLCTGPVPVVRQTSSNTYWTPVAFDPIPLMK